MIVVLFFAISTHFNLQKNCCILLLVVHLVGKTELVMQLRNLQTARDELARPETSRRMSYQCLCWFSLGTPVSFCSLKNVYVLFWNSNCPYECVMTYPGVYSCHLPGLELPLNQIKRMGGALPCKRAKYLWFRQFDWTSKFDFGDCQWILLVLIDYFSSRARRMRAWRRMRVCLACEWPAEGALTKLREFLAW